MIVGKGQKACCLWQSEGLHVPDRTREQFLPLVDNRTFLLPFRYLPGARELWRCFTAVELAGRFGITLSVTLLIEAASITVSSRLSVSWLGGELGLEK